MKKNRRESRKENDDEPGKAIKASECLAISAFLWCISATAFTSPTVSPVICAYIWVHHYTIIIVYSTANLLSQCKNTHTASQSKTQLLTLKLLAPGPHKWIALRRTDTLIQSWLSPETIGGGSSLGSEVGGKGIINNHNNLQQHKTRMEKGGKLKEQKEGDDAWNTYLRSHLSPGSIKFIVFCSNYIYIYKKN